MCFKKALINAWEDGDCTVNMMKGHFMFTLNGYLLKNKARVDHVYCAGCLFISRRASKVLKDVLKACPDWSLCVCVCVCVYVCESWVSEQVWALGRHSLLGSDPWPHAHTHTHTHTHTQSLTHTHTHTHTHTPRARTQQESNSSRMRWDKTHR